MDIGKLFLSVALATVSLCVLRAADQELEKEFWQEIALYRIRPDQSRSLKRDADGTPVSEARLQEAVGRFYGWLYPLDPAFLKRFQIKNVVFKDTVFDHDGEQYQMYPLGDTLFVDADLDEKQFYTNLFYRQIPVMPRSYLGHWNKLNPDDFSYEESRGSLSGHAQKKLEEVLNDWDKYFVSRAGMYMTEMDMAQTFAYMVAKGPDATAFVKENDCPTIRKKFDMIADILESVKATERGYMATLLADDLSKLKTYSPYALSVRLEREYSGVWTSWKESEPDATGSKQKTPRKIGDPVEVAGRKVNPLILALETKNNRLFDVLMANKADPDVANDRKMSALMLAIANNDPAQVKALLEAGAKVTQVAARAGTASGVNAEIMKLMSAYLPGVRESAVPNGIDPRKRDKTADKSSGAAESHESPEKELYDRLNAMKFEHLEFKKSGVADVVSLLQKNSKRLDPRGRGIRIFVSKNYSDTAITLFTEDVSMYEMLQLVCKNAGLAIRLEAPDKVYLVRPEQKQGETGKENGPAKERR